MRKFTKTHNDLDFLFPDIKESGDFWFDHWEKIVEYKFESAHHSQNTFSKDDIIDAFMKGASESQRTLILHAINAEQSVERILDENIRLTKQLQFCMDKMIELNNKLKSK